MKSIDILTEEFKTKFERFFIGCDALEEMNLWNKEEYGEMDVFFQNDLVSIILRLIVADGEISDKETEYLNKAFGFDYTTEELSEVYENCKDEISISFDELFKKGVALLRSINEKLAAAYKELIVLVCDIIIESDEIVAPNEIEEKKKVIDNF